MPNDRRFLEPGGTVALAVVTDNRLRFRVDSGGADISFHHPGEMIDDDPHGGPYK